MSVIKFNVGSKPTMTEAEVNASKTDGSKFLNDPGTFEMVIKAVEYKNASEKDTAWLGVNLTLEVNGKSLKYYLMIPTECRNSFLFGVDKQTFAIDKLRNFFRGLGLVFDFENGMEQVASLFGDVNRLVGKKLNVRLGYEGPHARYNGKDDYSFVEKDHVTNKLPGSFANKLAIEAAARDAGIKYNTNNDFIKVLEIFPSKEAQLEIGVSTQEDVADLPF